MRATTTCFSAPSCVCVVITSVLFSVTGGSGRSRWSSIALLRSRGFQGYSFCGPGFRVGVLEKQRAEKFHLSQSSADSVSALCLKGSKALGDRAFLAGGIVGVEKSANG
jgi:hypothetical protein